MRKHRLKNHLKLGILLLGVPLILVSCNKDDALHENLEANQNSDLNFKITSLNNLPKLKPIVKNIKTIKPKVDFDTNSPFSRIENIADLKHIDTDKIVQVTNNTGKSTYSFNIKKPSLSASINFENLYLAEKDDGYMSYILLYEPDYNWYQSHNKLEHGKYVLDFSDYQGHITKYTLDREIIWTTKSDAINTTAARTIEVCFISTWLGCKCNTAGHEDDLSNCTCVGTNSSQTCASGYVSGGYGSSNDDSDGTDSDNTNGGSGGGNATDVPCIPGANGVDTQPLSGSAIDLDGGVTQGTTTECIEQIHPVVIVEEEDDDCDTSKEELKKIFPSIPNADAKLLSSIINDKGADMGLDTKEELWHFLAQTGHETGGFTTLQVSENLSYSNQNLLDVWPNRFSQTDTTKLDPDDYKFDAEKLANYAYCCRMGNGNEASEDGWKYRGRGIKQLTGKTNYTDFKTWYNNNYDPDKDFVTNPNLISTNDTLAILSGLWFYKARVLDKITIDSITTVEKVTKKINGGTVGLPQRKVRFKKAKDSITCQ